MYIENRDRKVPKYQIPLEQNISTANLLTVVSLVGHLDINKFHKDIRFSPFEIQYFNAKDLLFFNCKIRCSFSSVTISPLDLAFKDLSASKLPCPGKNNLWEIIRDHFHDLTTLSIPFRLGEFHVQITVNFFELAKTCIMLSKKRGLKFGQKGSIAMMCSNHLVDFRISKMSSGTRKLLDDLLSLHNDKTETNEFDVENMKKLCQSVFHCEDNIQKATSV